MKLKLRSLVPLALATIAPASASHAGKAASIQDFAPRQMWSIRSEAPTTAKVVIGSIETWMDRVVVHISVVDIPARKETSRIGEISVVHHMPFEKSALAGSVKQLIASGVSPLPYFEDGYRQCRSARGGF